jgi:hypothetical protein
MLSMDPRVREDDVVSFRRVLDARSFCLAVLADIEHNRLVIRRRRLGLHFAIDHP